MVGMILKYKKLHLKQDPVLHIHPTIRIASSFQKITKGKMQRGNERKVGSV